MGQLPTVASPTVKAADLSGLSPFDGLLQLTGRDSPLDTLFAESPPEADPELLEQVRLAYALDPPTPTAGQASALQVINLVAQPGFSLPKLTQLVQRDPALSAGLIKAANSAAARGLTKTDTLRDAIVRLGAQEVGRIAGAVATQSLFEPQQQVGLKLVRAQLDACYADAVVTARVAAEQALRTRGALSDRVFLSALLHDLGRPVALRCLAALTKGRGTLPPRLIDAVVDQVHVELGVLAHERLALAQSATLVAANHHELDLPSGPDFVELHLVRLVSALVRWRREPGSILSGYKELDSSAEALELDAHALRALDTRVREALEARERERA